VKYIVRTFIAMTLFAFCWVAVGYGINQMLQIGTCASGGPYQVVQECPEGTGGLFFALFGGILGMFVAAGIYLARGKPPGATSPPQNAGIIVWFWTGLFWALAVGCFLGVWGPDANPGPGGKEGGLIVGFMGAIFGIGGLFAAGLGARAKRKPNRMNPVATKVAETASRFSTESDPVTRLDTLDRLRRQGTLTDAEFETLKAKIVREG
jgi:hypothetical protein